MQKQHISFYWFPSPSPQPKKKIIQVRKISVCCACTHFSNDSISTLHLSASQIWKASVRKTRLLLRLLPSLCEFQTPKEFSSCDAFPRRCFCNTVNVTSTRLFDRVAKIRVSFMAATANGK